MTKVLTAKDLIEKKGLIEEKKKEVFTIEVKGLGGFKFQVPTTYDIADSQKYAGGELADEYVIYKSCVEPNLKDQELQKEFGVSDPVEIVNAIFLDGEKTRVAQLLVDKAGYTDDVAKIVDDTKN